MKPFRPHFTRARLWVGCWLAALVAVALTSPVHASGATPVQQAYIKASNTGRGDLFGNVLAIWGDTMVVGAYSEDSNSTGVNGNQADNSALFAGAAYVYVRNGTNWVQQAYLKASNAGAGDEFGRSLAIWGDTVVVSSVFEASKSTGVNSDQSDNSMPLAGAVYVFVRNGTNWTQQAYLKASNTGVGNHFGHSVAIWGDTLVIGSDREPSNATGVNGNQYDTSAPLAGAAFIFVRIGTNWIQQAYLKSSNTGATDWFGNWVAVSGETVVIGAPREDSSATGVNGDQSDNSAVESGAAYVFVRNGTNWTQQAYLKASNTGADDWFGAAVSVSGDTVVVGASLEDSNATAVNGNQSDNSATDAGAAYVFVRNGTNWSQQAYLKASNAQAADHFGWSVFVSGETVLVGAYSEDSNATGVNGSLADNGALNSGAAYVFVRSGTNWIQQTYLKASNTGAGDSFGSSVAISEETLAVGAQGEASNATGVNGDQNDNGAAGSGAAYVFTGLGVNRRLALALASDGGYLLHLTGAPDVPYRVQRAATLDGPWDTLATLTAPASGQIEYHDTAPPPGQAFYRTVHP